MGHEEQLVAMMEHSKHETSHESQTWLTELAKVVEGQAVPKMQDSPSKKAY